MSMGLHSDHTPADVREGVRHGILSSIKDDVELRGSRTLRLLLAAGGTGVVGAIGATLLVSRHPFGHHPPWHLAVFSTVWAGLLIVTLAVAFLRIRTPSLPLARSAIAGILGLGLAGVCGAMCGEQHFMYWWVATSLGEPIVHTGGATTGAVCFGLVSTFVFASVSSFLALGDRDGVAVKPLLPAAILFALLLPGVVLQSVDAPLGVLAGWIAGTAAGAYVGTAIGARLRRLLPTAAS